MTLADELKALLEGRPPAQPLPPPRSPSLTSDKAPAPTYSMALNGDPLLSALKFSLGIG